MFLRRACFGWLVILGLLLLPANALATAPTVTLSDPANGALITTGQPDFVGTAGDSPADTGTVTVEVYAGTTSTGSPVQIINTNVANGAYSVKSVALPDGTYTAVADESDTSGNQGSSAPVTFQLFNGTPTLTLTAPPAPITNPEPSFTGTAATGPGDSTTAEVIIYPGTSTDATPVAVVSGPIQSDGTYSVATAPGLANGIYTAVASQQLALGSTFSPAVQFTIAASSAPLTVTAPAANASEPQTGVVFDGVAGADYGDDNQVDLTLYAGAKATGTPLGTATVDVSGTSWSDRWPSTLALGTYTLVVTQGDSSGQVTTVTRTFKVLAPGSVTGQVTISSVGRISAKLSCLDGAGTCNGDVLIVTQSDLQTVYGGPLGPLMLMFDHFSVPAAGSELLTAKLSAAQLSALRHAGPTKLVVTVAYPVGPKLTETSRTTAAVKIG